MKPANSISNYPVPQTYTFENALLKAIVSDSTLIDEAKKVVCADTFSDNKNKELWNTLVTMDADGKAINIESVYPQVDAAHFMNNIMPASASYEGISGFRDLLAAITNAAIKRKAYFFAVNLLSSASGNGNAETILESAGSFISDSTKTFSKDETQSLKDSINSLAAQVEEREKERLSGKRCCIPTGLPTLDYLCYGGFQKGQLIIVAARPSVGKTAIALQMARAAAQSQFKALFFSLEMTNVEITQRIMCATGRVTGKGLCSGEVDWAEFERAVSEVDNYPIRLNDTANDIDSIIMRIRENAKSNQCDIAFIDYLGLMSFPSVDKSANLTTAIADATKRLKALSKNLGIPIVLLCQLNRDMSREGRAPELHDLRSSGAIEQDADKVLMLEREKNEDMTLSNRINLYVRKNRNGRAGDKIRLEANENYTVFIEQTEAPF